MGTAGKIAIAVAGAAVLVVLFVVARPGGNDEADVTPAAQETQGTNGETETEDGATVTEPATTEEEDSGGDPDVVQARITIGPGGPAGVTRIDARRGQRVVLVVRSQIEDHVHVHGYDLFADVVPGRPARITFRADVPGRFEIELEDSHQQIADLRVQP